MHAMETIRSVKEFGEVINIFDGNVMPVVLT